MTVICTKCGNKYDIGGGSSACAACAAEVLMQRNALLAACEHYITCSHQSFCRKCMDMAVSAIALCEPLNQGVPCPTCGRVCADAEALVKHQAVKACLPEPGDEFVRPSDERHL